MNELAIHPSRTPIQAGAAAGLLPLVGIIALGFLAVGAALPSLSLYVHEILGFGTPVVGWVIGLQSVATVLTRHWSGTLSDHRGPRRAVLLGCPLAMASGVCYLASACAPADATTRLALLLSGSLVQGVGESLFVTGAMSWGIARLGPPRTGKVMAWAGIAIYGALGAGAPLGLAVQAAFGFAGIGVLTMAVAAAATIIAFRLPGVPPGGGQRMPFHRVFNLIWRPGLVLTLATVPFAAMATFLALRYAGRGWSGAGVALAGFGAGFVAVRLVGSHWPERFGGFAVATFCLALEAAGQAMIWLAPRPEIAAGGAVLTGIGFSLVFPAMGVEATRRVRPEQSGQAVGNFSAFFDVAVGATGPLVGTVVGATGTPVAFLIGAACPLAALVLLPVLMRMEAAQ